MKVALFSLLFCLTASSVLAADTRSEVVRRPCGPTLTRVWGNGNQLASDSQVADGMAFASMVANDDDSLSYSHSSWFRRSDGRQFGNSIHMTVGKIGAMSTGHAAASGNRATIRVGGASGAGTEWIDVESRGDNATANAQAQRTGLSDR